MRVVAALALTLALVAPAQETLGLTAPVGSSVTLTTTTKTTMHLLDFYWPKSLPRPVVSPALPGTTTRGTVEYRVVAPGEVEVTYRGRLASLRAPLELSYRVRYRGEKVEVVDGDRVLAELIGKLKLPPKLKDQLGDMLSGLPGFGQASVVPEYAVPLVPGASRVIAVPYLGGRTAETEVTYLGMEGGRHHFKTRVYLPYVELDWLKELMPPGSRALISIGPGTAEGEAFYYPNGLPAGSRTTSQALSFTYLGQMDAQFVIAARVETESETKPAR